MILWQTFCTKVTVFRIKPRIFKLKCRYLHDYAIKKLTEDMSFHKLSRLLLIAGSLLAFASCKEKEETTVSPALSGALTFNIDSYISPGEEVTLTPSGITHPDGKIVGYKWKVTPGMDEAKTTRDENGLGPDGKESDGSFTYKFPNGQDGLKTYTVTCTAFAAGYSSSYTSIYVTVVMPGLNGSLTGTGIMGIDKINVDGIDYHYTEHNGLEWLRSNLANPAYGVPYGNSKAISEILGRYYSHEEAEQACPDGWRLPTDREWRELAAEINGGSVTEEYRTIPGIAAALMADAKFNGKAMWEYWPEVGEITNKGKIAAIPTGYANLGEKEGDSYPMASFKGIYEYAVFWTADKSEDGMAYYRYLYCDQPDMFIGKGDTKTFGANVRCVR